MFDLHCPPCVPFRPTVYNFWISTYNYEACAERWKSRPKVVPILSHRDDFNFHITNFPFLSSNIPSSPAYGVFISQLIRYARACSSYECFILRLSNKLLGQGYVKERLKSSLRKFYGRYGDLTKQFEVPLSRMLHDILDDDHIQWHPPLIGHCANFWPLLIWTLLPNLTFYLIVQGFHRTYAMRAACQQRTLTPPDTWSCPTLGLACVLMSRPISPELVLTPDFFISNIPRYFSFALAYRIPGNFRVGKYWRKCRLELGRCVKFSLSPIFAMSRRINKDV